MKVEHLDIKKRDRIVDEYYLQCIKCGKEIKGTSNNSVLNNFRVHFVTQHPQTEADDKTVEEMLE